MSLAELNMKILVNGEEKSFKENSTVFDMLKELNLNSSGIVVEKNLQIIKKEDYQNTPLKDDDKFEIIRFMGGG